MSAQQFVMSGGRCRIHGAINSVPCPKCADGIVMSPRDTPESGSGARELRDAVVAVLDALPPDLDRHADCEPPEDDIPGSGCDEHRLAVAVRRLRAILDTREAEGQ